MLYNVCYCGNNSTQYIKCVAFQKITYLLRLTAENLVRYCKIFDTHKK